MRFKFIGDPANEYSGPSSLQMGGYEFPRGKFVEVKGHLAERLKYNGHFEMEMPDSVPVSPQIPEDWESLHHKTKMKLARELDPVMSEAINNVADAEEIIREHVNGHNSL
jgi:hypothetical protein